VAAERAEVARDAWLGVAPTWYRRRFLKLRQLRDSPLPEQIEDEGASFWSGHGIAWWSSAMVPVRLRRLPKARDLLSGSPAELLHPPFVTDRRAKRLKRLIIVGPIIIVLYIR
jgi:hypothetical protein